MQDDIAISVESSEYGGKVRTHCGSDEECCTYRLDFLKLFEDSRDLGRFKDGWICRPLPYLSDAIPRQHIVKYLPIGEYAVILPRKLMDVSSYSGITKLSEVLRSYLSPNDLCCLLFQLQPAEYP